MGDDTFAHRVARATSKVTAAVGSPLAIVASMLVVVIWAASGPLFGFSSGWQLVINTGTTIVTFLMVFAIQNSQNRGDLAVHVKLDAILQALEHVDDKKLVGLEDSPEDVIADAGAALRSD